MAMIACKSMDSGEQIYYKTRENKTKTWFFHPRFWIEVLKHYVLRHFSSLKNSRVFTGEHFWPFSLICFKNRYNQRFWAPLKNQSGVHNFVFGGPRFCRTGGFSKNASLFYEKSDAKKAWNMGKRSAKCKKKKNSPWNAARQLVSGCFSGSFRVFSGCFPYALSGSALWALSRHTAMSSDLGGGGGGARALPEARFCNRLLLPTHWP